MTAHPINSARVQRRYSALSLPLRESMLNALQRHQDAAQDDELAAPPLQDATDNGCKGASHE
jgi:hypothetical protein